ncbi:MAG: hypothetical protein ACW99R_15630 [Candidatus Hodarchaeales archaeon]|jgi:hypothetical protein
MIILVELDNTPNSSPSEGLIVTFQLSPLTNAEEGIQSWSS